MITGYAKNKMGRLALGTHLGDFSKEDSAKYIEAISYALTNGMETIDGAINYFLENGSHYSYGDSISGNNGFIYATYDMFKSTGGTFTGTPTTGNTYNWYN